jgi:putative flippase GtrA
MLKPPAMNDPPPFARLFGAIPWVRRSPFLSKAISFGLIGVVNAGVDASIFFLARAALMASGGAVAAAAAFASACDCTAAETPIIVAANTISWLVAVTGSYVMNTSITFAAESGRQLRWKDYARFAASGVVGLIANTATLVAAYDHMPIWAAKGCAILAGFVVNFGLSHFVVFRPRKTDPAAPH